MNTTIVSSPPIAPPSPTRAYRLLIDATLIENSTNDLKKLIVRVKNPSTNAEKSEQVLYLKEISEQELFKLRLGNKPGFVLKSFGKYYYTEISRDWGAIPRIIFQKHCCCSGNAICLNLSADKISGCPKVKDRFFTTYPKSPKTLEISKRLEKYPFILRGAETFNLKPCHNSFIVEICVNYNEQYCK